MQDYGGRYEDPSCSVVVTPKLGVWVRDLESRILHECDDPDNLSVEIFEKLAMMYSANTMVIYIILRRLWKDGGEAKTSLEQEVAKKLGRFGDSTTFYKGAYEAREMIKHF